MDENEQRKVYLKSLRIQKLMEYNAKKEDIRRSFAVRIDDNQSWLILNVVSNVIQRL